MKQGRGEIRGEILFEVTDQLPSKQYCRFTGQRYDFSI